MKQINNIRSLSFEELKLTLKKSGQPAFRAKQLYEWIWKKCAVDFEAMSDLPKDLRTFLSEHFILDQLKILSSEKSNDKSLKYLFRLNDEKVIEGVLIPTLSRNTICISSQVGCKLGCKFCATGFMGLKRNLTFDEIFDQVALLNKECIDKYGKKISNIVMMGMGEPLLNYDEVIKAFRLITSPESLGFSPQRITLSTVGIPEKIKQLANDGIKINLAVSLNSGNNEKRNKIMPANKSFPLEALHDALRFYQEKTKDIITIEYILLKGFNDDLGDVKDLVKFLKGLRVKINLIEYNPVEKSSFKKASLQQLGYFKSLLENNHLIVNIRNSRGKIFQEPAGNWRLSNKCKSKDGKCKMVKGQF